MKVYDISQRVFGCKVYPGDPFPKKEALSSMKDGALYNLTAFSMCAHNGTHVDAPFHFIDDGSAVDEIPLEKTVGLAYVAEHDGRIGGCDAEEILQRARRADPEAAKRILIKGNAELSIEGAEVIASSEVLLFGNESQTVGPEDAPMAVHLKLLGRDIVLLEGIRLSHVKEGVYFLSAAPLALEGADGAPCRALLVDMNG